MHGTLQGGQNLYRNSLSHPLHVLVQWTSLRILEDGGQQRG
uniref:Uncharacterized protein n=1 Tax=Anguilla anguilla TaxID=7936 RepID=A0A0E9TZE3_ANGAN